MSATKIPYGHPLAEKVFAVALFAKIHHQPGFMNLLSGTMPGEAAFSAKVRGQTSPGFPVVKSGDLSKTSGDTVQIDLFNELRGYPVMGDKRIEGRMMGLTSSSAQIRIDQYRAGADTGGRMSQKRTSHKLRMIALAHLTSFMQRYEDQSALVHLAGARGFAGIGDFDWTIPPQSHAEFNEIMINPVLAPTKNRQFYAGDATNPEDMGTNDALTIQDIQRISSQIRGSSIRMQSIKMPGDGLVWDKPLFLLLVSEWQWLYLRARTGQTSWNQLVRDAYARKTKGVKHPIFDYVDDICVDGVLVRPMSNYSIRFGAGNPVTVDTGGTTGKTFTEVQKAAAVPMDRAILVGAQALGKVYGRSQTDYFYNWSEEKKDHGNTIEIVPGAIGGCSKLRFNIEGVDTDIGVAVIDSYAPDPDSVQGRTLLRS